jgi:hypothetical protein
MTGDAHPCGATHEWEPGGWSAATIIPSGQQLSPHHEAIWRMCRRCGGLEWRQAPWGTIPENEPALTGVWLRPRISPVQP